jgi:transposase
MVLLSVQGLAVAGIAKVTLISADRVREVINNFNADGFDVLYPKYAGGRPPVFSLPQRRETKQAALSRPGDHGLPFFDLEPVEVGEVSGGAGGGR